MLNISQFRWLALVALTALTIRCGDAPSAPRLNGLTGEGDAKPKPSDDGGGGGDGGETDGSANSDGGDGGGTTDGDATDGGNEPPPPVANDCGAGGAALNETYTQELKGLPYTFEGRQILIGNLGTDFTATVNATLVYELAQVAASQTTTMAVTADPERTILTADPQAKAYAGPVAGDAVPVAQRGALIQRTDGWAGLACSVSPVTKITATLGRGAVAASFDPPLPRAIHPAVAPERLAEELATERAWSITATILNSADPALVVGSKRSGTVTLKPIDKAFPVQTSDGSTITVGGDLAYELRYDFGGALATAALGLPPVTRVFIDAENGRFKSIVVETGEAGLAPVVYVGSK